MYFICAKVIKTHTMRLVDLIQVQTRNTVNVSTMQFVAGESNVSLTFLQSSSARNKLTQKKANWMELVTCADT